MMMSKNKFIKENVTSDPQEEINSSQAQKVKNKRNYQLFLNAEVLNSQLVKRKESTKWRFAQSKITEGADYFRAFAKTLKSQSNAQELRVFGGRSVNIRNQSLSFISKAMKNFESLQTLSLVFLNCNKITDEGLVVMSQVLKRVFGGKTLILRLDNCSNEVSDIGVQKICQSLRKLTSLEDLTLEFGGSNKITSTSLRLVGKSVKRLKSLANLSLIFNHWRNINEDALSYLGKSLVGLSHLKSLDLGFFVCSQLSESGVLDLCKNLENLRSLKSLSLQLPFCDIVSDEFLRNLGACLQGIIPGLDSLILNFYYCLNITNAGFAYFFQGFKNLINLQVIRLRFSSCDLGDTGITYLSSALKNMPNLKSLSLEFTNCRNLKNPGLLTQSLSTLKALQKIHLIFERDKNITNEGFVDIFRMLSHLPLLLSMKISFQGCEVTDQGLEEISQHLQKFTGLKVLDLNFSYCGKFSDLGLESMIKSLRNMLLQELCLNFSSCAQITDNTLKRASEGLKNMIYLRDLQLEFAYCPQVTDEGLIVLVQGLKKHPALKETYIGLFGCKNITEKSIEKEKNNPNMKISIGH